MTAPPRPVVRDLVGLVRSAEAALRHQYTSRDDRALSFEAFVAARLVDAGFTGPVTDVVGVVREALGEETRAGA